MPYLDLTQLNDLQFRAAINEKRFQPHGILDAAIASTPFVNFLTPEVVSQMNMISDSRNVQLPVMIDQIPVVTANPGFDVIPANLAETTQYTFTTVNVFSGMRLYPGSFENNTINMDWYKDEVMLNVLEAMARAAEERILTVMETIKSQIVNFTDQISQGPGTYTFNAVTDTLELSKAAQEEAGMLTNLDGLMRANDLPGTYRYVYSRLGLQYQITESMKFGLANQENKQAFGLLDFTRLHETNVIAPGSDIFNGFLVQDGGIGIVENYPYDFRNQTRLADKEWTVTPGPMPLLNMRVNAFVNRQPTDATSIVQPNPGKLPDSNLLMSTWEEMALWAKFFVVFPFNSDRATRPGRILKLQGLTV